MKRRSSPLGPLVAIAGASLVLVSLWLPWYELRLPEAIREAFRRFGDAAAPGAAAGGGQENPFGQLFEGLAAVIPDTVKVSGWQGMEQGDIALAVIASLVLLTGIAAGGILGPSVRADAGLAGRLTALLGAGALAVSGYHVLTRPGADFPGTEDFITLRAGVWVAVLGSALIVASGLIGASAQQPATGAAWSAGAPAGGQADPATAAAQSGTWAGPAGDAAVTPLYTATPSGSTAPPGLAP